MAKKQLNTTAIANELAHSAFFAPPPQPPQSVLPPQPPYSPHSPAVVPQAEVPLDPPTSQALAADTLTAPTVPSAPTSATVRPTERPLHPLTASPMNRSNERTSVRHSFDILADQLFSLRSIALTREQQTGEHVLLGDLVKEALDQFIAKQRTDERIDE